MRVASQRPDKSREIVRRLLDWFEQNARPLPWRRTADPYAIWISEVMLQQTQVKTVIPYWTRWMKRFPHARALAQARPQEVLKLWEGLGYYSRARNAQAAAQVIAKKFGGHFPTAFEDVLELPGVGRYTAGAVCSIALNQPRPIVDGNVARVLCRIFGIRRPPRQKAASAQLWRLAQELVDVANLNLNLNHFPDPAAGGPAKPPAGQRTCSAFNQALMELGALVCTALQPKCSACPVRDCCFAFETGMVSQLPARTAAAGLTRRRFVAFIVQRNDRFLTRQRPAGGVNAHFWEFPNVEVQLSAKNLEGVARPFALAQTVPCGRVCHTITRSRIELTAYRAELPEAMLDNGNLGVWRTAAQMRQLPMTRAHRRILEQLRRRK